MPAATNYGGSRLSTAPTIADGGRVARGPGRPGQKHLEGTQSPTLTLEKIAPGEVQVGKPASFVIKVRNLGGVAAHQIEIHDEIPQGTQLIATNPRATRGPRGELVWAVGTLKPGEETAVQADLLPTVEGELGSVATIHFTSEVSVRTKATRPEIALEVSAPAEVLIGDNMALRIKVANTGTGVATGVVLSELVPASLEHEAGGELEYAIGDLRPNEVRELDLTMKAVKPGSSVNVLMVRGDGQIQVEKKTPFNVVAPALEVALEGPRRRFLDRPATYTVSISNPGTAAAQEVELVTYLPRGLDFVEANNAGQYNPQTHSVHWLLEELPARERGAVTVTTMPIEAGEQPLKIASTARRGLTAEKQEPILIEGLAAILFQVADVADPIEVGGETVYEVRIVNQGSKAASNVQVLALLPPELKIIGAEGPTRHEVVGQQVRFQELPQLAPKADTTYRIRAQGLAPGDMRVRVQVMTDENRTPITKEEATRVFADQ
jgi:uncharacterized repeat protein (TIGR01451 family)